MRVPRRAHFSRSRFVEPLFETENHVIADAINCEELIYDLNFSVVREWKYRHPGAKAIAYFPVYAPVELIHACGMLPVGLNGAGDRLDIQHADAKFGSFICSIVKTTLEMGLTAPRPVRWPALLVHLRFGAKSVLRDEA